MINKELKEKIQLWVTNEAQLILNNYYNVYESNKPITKLTVTFGRKYAHVRTSANGYSTVWAFVVLTDDQGYPNLGRKKVGDVLTPASYGAPNLEGLFQGNVLFIDHRGIAPTFSYHMSCTNWSKPIE